MRPGNLRLLGVHRGVVLLRDDLVVRGRGARSGVLISVVATSKEKRIWVLRPSGSSGSCRRPVRTNGLSRAAARAECSVGIVSSCITSPVRARPSAVVASKVVPTVSVAGVDRFRRCGTAWRAVRRAGAIARVSVGEGSFARPYNNRMEPSRPTVRCYPVAAARGSFGTLDSRSADEDDRIWPT